MLFGASIGLPAAALIALMWVIPEAAVAQTPQVWGALEQGPFGVGYRVEFEMDRSRGYRPPVDWLGRPDSLETGRPMQVSVWYPTNTAGTPGTTMTFGEYVRVQAGARGPSFETDEDRREFELALTRGPLSPFFDGQISGSELERVLATPMAAVRGATPADGRFPVVIHIGFSLVGQTVMLEYLASHGFVVLSVPLLGTAPVWFNRGQGTPEWYQTGANDVGYVHAFAHDLGHADASRTAMIGMMSAFGLLYQMQHMRLRALASLDGSYPPVLRSVPGFDSVAVRIPILDMPRTEPGGDRSMLEGLLFADRYLVSLDDVTHGDFYQFQRIAHPERAEDHTAYTTIAETTRRFLTEALGDSGRADLSYVTGRLDTRRIAAADPVPTAEEFLLLVREGRIDDARRAWERATCPNGRAAVGGCRTVSESDLTTTLLFSRRDHGPEAALEGFILLTEMFPDSDDARNHLETTRRAASREEEFPD